MCGETTLHGLWGSSDFDAHESNCPAHKIYLHGDPDDLAPEMSACSLGHAGSALGGDWGRTLVPAHHL